MPLFVTPVKCFFLLIWGYASEYPGAGQLGQKRLGAPPCFFKSAVKVVTKSTTR